MQFRTAARSFFFFNPIPKMEFQYVLMGTLLSLLLQLSRPIDGQSQQLPQSKFLPNIFSSIQATLGSFNRFSYIPRPVGPFPGAGYRPSEINFGYLHSLVPPVPQQPVVRFIGPTRTRQNVPLPTSPSISDEVRQQLVPKWPPNSDTGVSPPKHPPAPPLLSMLPLSPDNRHFHDVRFIQPPSVTPTENSRKEIPVEKFHKPVRADTVFGNGNIRKSIAPAVIAPSSSDNALVKSKNQHGPHNTEVLLANTKFYDVSSQTTRTSPHVSKERRRPFDNFKPIIPHTKTFPTRKPALPQLTETHNQLPEFPKVEDGIDFEGEELSVNNPISESNISVVPAASVSHSIHVKLLDNTVKRPEVSEEEKGVHSVMKEPTIPSLPEKETQDVTQKPEGPSDASSAPDDSEFADENLSEKSMTELPSPPDELHSVSEDDSFPKIKSVVPLSIVPNVKSVVPLSIEPKVKSAVPLSIVPKVKSAVPPSEVDRLDETPSTSNWALGDNNKLLTGTPEELLTLKLSDAINNFGFGLYRKLEETNNLFFSPVSLSAALAIVLEGASNMTALQMMNSLHFSESNIRLDEVKSGFKRLMKSLKSTSSDYQFENANLLLLQSKFFFRSEFSNNVYRHYKPLLGSVDFAANGLNIKRSVNDWVSRKTHGKIKEFLTEKLPSNTVFTVLNAVYFRGRWIQPFDSTLTGPSLFYNFGKDPVEITMMKQIGTFAVGYSANLNSQIIELPYEGEETSMVIVLPEERDGIYDLRNNLNYQELYVILSAIDFQLIRLSFPQFSLRSRYDMEDVLKEMGMRDVFISGKANFGRMTNVTGLYLSKVCHEGVIDVDEKGTEAAASTGAFVVPLSRPRAIIVDHPFFFFIRNQNNGAILFIGQFDAFDA